MLKETHCSPWAYRMSTHPVNVGCKCTSPLQAFFLVGLYRDFLSSSIWVSQGHFLFQMFKLERAFSCLPFAPYSSECHCWEVCQRGRTHAGLSSIFPALTSQASEAFTPLPLRSQLLPICHTVMVNDSLADWPLYSFWPWLLFE